MQTGEAALESLRQTLGAECPGQPQPRLRNEAAAALSNEVIGTMSVVFIRADVQAVDDFAETVAQLHWSNQKLTHRVTTYAAKFKTLAALEMPGVCGECASVGRKRLQDAPREHDAIRPALQGQ